MKHDAIFSFNDYKGFIRAQIKATDASWGLISKLAEAAGCQRSYLSRVLNSEIHLTPDHAFGLCEYWNLPEEETKYFLALLEKDRASSLRLRERNKRRLQSMKAEYENLQKRVQRPLAELNQKEFVYYSTWYFSALHIVVSIPKYQTTKAIADRLQLDISLVEDALEQLKAFGLIRHERGKWIFNASETHVSKDSPLVSAHHNNWRARAVQDAQKRISEGLHFTVVQSLDQDAWDKIKNKMIQFIEEANTIASPSAEEKLICLTCDFFEV